MWILIVVSAVFSSSSFNFSIYPPTPGISSVTIERFSTKENCMDAVNDIYAKVKSLGYYDPQKYVRASCIPSK